MTVRHRELTAAVLVAALAMASATLTVGRSGAGTPATSVVDANVDAGAPGGDCAVTATRAGERRSAGAFRRCPRPADARVSTRTLPMVGVDGPVPMPLGNP